MSDKIHIKLKSRDKFLIRGCEVPGYLWQERPHVFNPYDFAVGGDRINEKLFSSEVQIKSLERFRDRPTAPLVYGVSSAPNDANAKYFAAYLCQLFIEGAPPNVMLKWETLYGNSFSNPSMDIEPGLLVITGLSPASSNTKIDKARDLLEKHSDIPRIVVIAGEDPITFFYTRLYHAVHNVYFHSTALVKRKSEVI